MNSKLSDEVLGDAVAVSLANIVATANVRARELGFVADECFINISQDGRNSHWRVNYGPREPAGRRGGDLIIDVNPQDGSIARVLRGQ